MNHLLRRFYFEIVKITMYCMRDVVNKEKKKFFLKLFLKLFSLFYYFIIQIRLWFFNRGIILSKIFFCKTIAIGNLYVGGTGKTPFTVYIAKLIRKLGLNAVIVSRGYGARINESGLVVDNDNNHFKSVSNFGDESYLIFRLLNDIPVIVGKNKLENAVKAIIKFSPDVIIFDDAFQYLKILYNINFLLMDSWMPIGNGFIFPRGFLREPISSLYRADSMVFTRYAMKKLHLNIFKIDACFLCNHKIMLRKVIPKFLSKRQLIFRGKTVISVSGLADNSRFNESLLNFGFLLKGEFNFTDHHTYTSYDFEKIDIIIRKTKAQYLVTTDKDYVKIAGKVKFIIPILVFGVDINFGKNEYKIKNFFLDFLSKKYKE